MLETKPKLLILGYARHGKDTVAELLRDDYGYQFTSSSMFVAEECLWDSWGCAVYPDFEAMYADRVNHRELWMQMISAYNTPEKTKTASTMLSRGFDLYVGMRRHDELLACQEAGIFDFIIWVDASLRHPPETGSMDITEDNCGADFVIYNNGKLEDLPVAVADCMDHMMDAWKKRNGIPDHPWDSMTPLETLADWLGTDVDELLSIGKEPEQFGCPVRAAPPEEVLVAALQQLNAVMWSDPIDGTVVVKKAEPETIMFHFVTPPEHVESWVRKLFVPEDDPKWNNIFLDVLDDFSNGGRVDPEPQPVGMNGPEFVSRRSKVGAIEEHTTTTQGATTIINIENVYVVGKDED